MSHPIATPLTIVARPRLEELHRLLGERRLCLISAGAGYGKTTLLGVWREQAPTGFVTCTEGHGNLGVFATTVTNALRAWIPGLQPRTTGVESMSGPAVASELIAAAAPLMQRPIRLFFDDVDELRTGESARFLQSLVLQAPQSLGIVLAGRSEPPVRIARLRGRGQLLELTAADLRFTFDETTRFVAATAPEVAGYVDEIHATTGGWPAAVRLTVEALRGSPVDDRLRVLERARRPGGTLFAYLADEVIDSEPPPAREMLRTLAAIGAAPDALVLDVCGGEETLLAGLQRRGLCVASGPDISVPPLVADFLASDAPLEATERLGALERAAHWFCDHGMHRRALELATRRGATELAAAICLEHGEQIADSGGAAAVLAALRTVDEKDLTPALLRLKANVLHTTGDWDAALAIYEGLDGGAASIPADLAWRMGLIHLLRGDPHTATEVYRRADITTQDADTAILLGWWASAAWITAETAHCRSLANESLATAQRVGDDRALAVAHTVLAMVAAVDGDRHGNEAHYIAALDHAKRADDVLQQVRIHVNRASHHLEEGHYLESIAESDQALTLAELGDIVPFKAMALLNRGQALSRLGRLEAADADFAAAHSEWERTRSRHVAYALNAFGESRTARGVRSLARSAHEQALAIAEANSDTQALIPALVGLAKVTIDDDPATARLLAKRAADHGPSLGTAAALLALGWAELELGNTEAAIDNARRAGDIARARRDRAATAEALELEAFAAPDEAKPLLDEALELWGSLDDPLGHAKSRLARCRLLHADIEELDELAALFGRLGARHLAAETRAMVERLGAERRNAVVIETLGGFRVVTGGEPVPASAWQSRKARDLCKLLVTRRGKPVHREVLLEELWPGEDGQKTANRLSVALSTLRNVFDPERTHDPDHYIAADKTSVALVLEALEIDVERFISAARDILEHPDASEARLERIEAAYRGDFLEEDPYADWAVSLREEARSLYLRLARRLAELTSERGDHDAAARYHLRVLERDPYDEPAHLGLVSAMAATGRHGEARRLYRAYCERMADLDVDPHPFPAEGHAATQPAFRKT